MNYFNQGGIFMKTKIIRGMLITVFCVSCVSLLMAQTGSIWLTFNADNNGVPVSPDSVWIKNLTKDCDTTLYAPDLTLVIDTLMTGTQGTVSGMEDFRLVQNYPNPFRDHTNIGIILPERDWLTLFISNLAGQKLSEYSGILNEGTNTFVFIPGSEKVYLLTAVFKDQIRTIRMLAAGKGSNTHCRLYFGTHTQISEEKSSAFESYFDYDPGDELLFIGYSGNEESGFTDSPIENSDYTFQFATNIPCPGLDSIYYENKWYHTIQIFSQCWMKENLDAGTMIMGSQNQSDNGLVEKYCYANNVNNCAAKGGLYIWEEMMHYTTVNGSQGICPEGWHVPTDEEWNILEGAADSQFGMGHPVWSSSNIFRGLDAGYNLKSTSGWSANGNGDDLYGFTGLPGGYWWELGFFENTTFGILWTSTLSDQMLPWFHGFRMDMNSAARNTFDGICGYSVRCLKDQ